MCALDVKNDSLTAEAGSGDLITNDFAITVATKNGSGSQTSNNVLVKALFKMGIPVNGKNLFPSNIKGLPTWYTIRVSKEGYTARRASTEVAVVMNEQTAAEDISDLASGGVCVIPSEWKWTQSRDDLVYYEIPVKDIVEQAEIAKDFRDRVANMVYVGAVSRLFHIPLPTIYQALLENFDGKEKPARMNYQVVEMASEWTADNIQKRDPFQYEAMSETAGKILISGNEAAALGALFGGVNVAAWYPITPSTSLIDALMTYQDIRRDSETGKQTLAIVQAEDEIAAIGMIVGAGWAGARAMTATSGPGISLMAEFAGLAYFAEIPIVIWDVTRVGPSTGLPTRTSQGDLMFAHYLGHGDTRQLCLLPGNMEECFEFGWRAFDLADEFQAPIFVLSDLDLGMNNWMSDPFAFPEQPFQRGKRLDNATFNEFVEAHGEWYRYRDYDEDGITYRTIPGTSNPHSAYLTRGTGHSDMATYSERSDDWLENMERLERKLNLSRQRLPQPVIDHKRARRVGIISHGSNDPAIQEARDLLAAEGIETNYLRVRALPLADSVIDFTLGHDRVYVVENNHAGQLLQIIRINIPEDTRHVVSLASGDTLPMTATWVVDRIREKERE